MRGGARRPQGGEEAMNNFPAPLLRSLGRGAGGWWMEKLDGANRPGGRKNAEATV